MVEDDRPREKLQLRGAGALTDAELLAILIGSGTRDKSALDLAYAVLEVSRNNLYQLGRLSIRDLKLIKGIGEARAITIAAALELGRRRRMQEGIERETVHNSKDAVEILFPLLQDYNHEVFCALYMDAASHFIQHQFISNGGISATVADVRIILKLALECHASKIIVAHNHPSGNTAASGEDKKLTLKLKEAAKVMDIALLDHIIIAGTQFTSMADEGWL